MLDDDVLHGSTKLNSRTSHPPNAHFIAVLEQALAILQPCYIGKEPDAAITSDCKEPNAKNVPCQGLLAHLAMI